MLDKVTELKVFKDELVATRNRLNDELVKITDQLEKKKTRLEIALETHSASAYDYILEAYIEPLRAEITQLKEDYKRIDVTNSVKINAINDFIFRIDAAIKEHE